ncbi:hypothetical protein [Polynucleobacter sp. CS-Odin-A6]|uniref:hypothetical protein n=1 Tax=Polynucleobacter sp. CS-Odin-A6 TaxID=2689106 RepID=UPI001C0B205E|nr:hypothetical protein [Polynucleobacter sp. CS-Odin-A6]MBU3621824.1 hypothetical protein [Polynucleobacter sp. CS-Odin-A6]
MQITPYAPGEGLSVSDVQERNSYAGALAAALRTGNVLAAQKALLGLQGSGGGMSPASLFNSIDLALIGGRAEDIKNASAALDKFRAGGGEYSDKKFFGLDPHIEKPSDKDKLMVASGMGSLINIKV